MTSWILKRINTRGAPIGTSNWSEQIARDSLLLGAVVLCCLAIYFTQPELFQIITSTLSDAYLGVSIFVAATLGVFYTLDRWFQQGITDSLKRSRLQVPVAALLGALPGCGGAIIVVTQFVNGHLRFGSLVAVLVATMGDAAFLLLAKEPSTAMLVYGTSLAVGTISGSVINLFCDKDYLRPKSKTDLVTSDILPIQKSLTLLFFLLLVPGVVLGLLEAFQVDTNAWFLAQTSIPVTELVGVFGALICLLIWIKQPLNSWSFRFSQAHEQKDLKEAVTAETSFVSAWVIAGFLAYELFIYATGADLGLLFSELGLLTILLAIVIGFIPGCGPQIVVTTLYLNGIVPLSAQLANAISNDGDALFPAIALAPEAAIKATLYSAIPAALVGYIAYFGGW